MNEVDTTGLVAEVLKSPKYRHVSPLLVLRIGERELANQPDLKSAIKSTKNRLHQVAGAYLDSPPNYARWRAEIAGTDSQDAIRELSRNWIRAHSSTRERLPILETFYSTNLGSLGPIRSVIDIACGLGPLAIPWMGLPLDVTYDAYDIYGDMMEFLGEYLARIKVDGGAHCVDCVGSPPKQSADLALILKFLPVLEQQDKRGTLDWLKSINARHMLISFPTRSLGGKGKGMGKTYEARFMEMVSNEPWNTVRHEFPNELCFVVSRTG